MKNGRTLDYAERWLRDGIEITRPPVFFVSVDVDMTQVQKLFQHAAERDFSLTYAPVLVRAAALSLVMNPDLNLSFARRRKNWAGKVDIGLSISGETFVAPVLVIENADKKKLSELANEIQTRVPDVRAADRKLLIALRKWGWLIPFALARKAVLRISAQFATFQKKHSGTFQVSVLAGVDQFVTPLFGTAGILCAGRVRDRVVVVDGRAEVRPIVTLSCGVDHRIWDGMSGERFLCGVRDILEGNYLLSEI